MSDTLNPTSRAFFERTKMKMVFSLVIGASALLLLAFASAAGGNANEANESSQTTKAKTLNDTDDHWGNSYQALVGGYGFACFMFLMASLLLIYGAFYASPQCCGSANEKKMLGRPEELDEGQYSAYTEQTGNKV